MYSLQFLSFHYLYSHFRHQAIQKFNAKSLAEEVRHIKEKALSNLPNLIQQTMDEMTQNGIHVSLASTAKDARNAVLEIVKDDDLIVQGSSDVPVEIDLDQALIRLQKEFIATG